MKAKRRFFHAFGHHEPLVFREFSSVVEKPRQHLEAFQEEGGLLQEMSPLEIDARLRGQG